MSFRVRSFWQALEDSSRRPGSQREATLWRGLCLWMVILHGEEDIHAFYSCALSLEVLVFWSIFSDDPVRRAVNHLEQRERLGISSGPSEWSNPCQFPSEPKSALQKVEVCDIKGCDIIGWLPVVAMFLWTLIYLRAGWEGQARWQAFWPEQSPGST